MVLYFLVELLMDICVGDFVLLIGVEVKYVVVVWRLCVGEVVMVGDGVGVWFEGIVEEVLLMCVDVCVLECME